MNERDPNGIPQNAPGAKLDAGKTRTWLMLSGFARALDKVARVTTVGAKKYTPGGWAEVQDGPDRYMDAFGRHMLALGSGEVVDLDTQCLHKAQMVWNLLASLELELRGGERRTEQVLTPTWQELPAVHVPHSYFPHVQKAAK